MLTDPLNTNRVNINTIANADRLLTMRQKTYVEAGGLMSYGPTFQTFFVIQQTGRQDFTRSKPGDIPVEQPTKFDLAINLTTARTPG